MAGFQLDRRLMPYRMNSRDRFEFSSLLIAALEEEKRLQQERDFFERIARASGVPVEQILQMQRVRAAEARAAEPPAPLGVSPGLTGELGGAPRPDVGSTPFQFGGGKWVMLGGRRVFIPPQRQRRLLGASQYR